jgi:DNA replication protein DnaC
MTARADPASSVLDRIRHSLVSLRMPRALEMIDDTVRQLERGEVSPLEAIETLLAEELSLRESRRIKTALVMARLSTIKTLTGFVFAFQPSLDRNRVLALAQLDFIDRHEVLHLLGPPGTGKSHLAIALGVEAVKAGRSVYFVTLADLVGALAKAEREGRLRDKIRFFCRAALLIVDEIGYLPVVPDGGSLFFQLVNARYERGAMLLTCNRGCAEWGEIFGDPVVATALLDRLLRHAVVIQIEGSSYRLRQHEARPRAHPRQGSDHAAAAGTAPPRSSAQNQRRQELTTEPRHLGKFTSALLRKFQSALTRASESCARVSRSCRSSFSTARAGQLADQVSTLPSSSPSTTKRQMNAASATVGMTARTTLALSKPQETSVLRASAAMTTDSGRLAASPESTSPNRNSA